jgi:hypothetical protein
MIIVFIIISLIIIIKLIMVAREHFITQQMYSPPYKNKWLFNRFGDITFCD